jgi:hypothetical protein
MTHFRLIAIMLGGLRMPTDEALREYSNLASAIFNRGNRKHAHKDATFRATTLENGIKDLVAANALGNRMVGLPPATSPSKSDHIPGCRTFACAILAHDMAHLQRFRTYAACALTGPDYFIWEAARAMTVAPTLFKRIAIASTTVAQSPWLEFVNGGVRCNNPVDEVINEARAVFGWATRLGCLVSISAGHAGVIGLAPPDVFERLLLLELISALRRMATDCESEAQQAAWQFAGLPDRYFGFNVAHGAGAISLEEWKHMDKLVAHTAAYLKDTAVSQAVDRLVKWLCAGRAAGIRGSPVSLDALCT